MLRCCLLLRYCNRGPALLQLTSPHCTPPSLSPQDVRDKKLDVMDTNVTTRGLWRYTPVRVNSVVWRGFWIGVYTLVLLGLPTTLIMWMALGSTSMPGLPY